MTRLDYAERPADRDPRPGAAATVLGAAAIGIGVWFGGSLLGLFLADLGVALAAGRPRWQERVCRWGLAVNLLGLVALLLLVAGAYVWEKMPDR